MLLGVFPTRQFPRRGRLSGGHGCSARRGGDHGSLGDSAAQQLALLLLFEVQAGLSFEF
jgi:hypothetical protein